MRKKLISLLLISALLLTMLPAAALAADQTSGEDALSELLAYAQAAEDITEEESWYDSMKGTSALTTAAAEDSTAALATASYPTNYPNTWVNSGNQAVDIAEIARSQIGYTEIQENHTKYNAWFYGTDYCVSWCGTFISWCAAQANVPASIMARTALAGPYSLSTMQNNSFGAPAYAFGAKTPKAGDVAYITSGGSASDHVGLVIGVDNNYIYTAEGNASDTVGERKYSLATGYQAYGGGSVSSSIRIVFLARPNYTGGDIYVYGQHTSGGSISGNQGIVTNPEPVRTTISGFDDVYEDMYYASPVTWAVEKKIAYGVENRSFAPDAACNRAQAITFLWRAMGQPEPTQTENPFTDVSPNDYYYKAVLWAVQNGVTSGVSEDAFGPEEYCTRAQFVTFLYRASGKPEVYWCSYLFWDVSMYDYFFYPVTWAVNNSITSGTTATTFSPEEACTRGQVVTFLYRYAQ